MAKAKSTTGMILNLIFFAKKSRYDISANKNEI